MQFFRSFTFVVLVCLSQSSFALNVQKYLPKDHTYDSAITQPETSLGFGIGERHIRHDQLVRYFEVLSQESDKVRLTNIGYTNEMRKQFLVTISHPRNLEKLPTLLANHSMGNNPDEPLVIWLGYSVHGDEITGSNAALVVAYHLASSQHKSVADILENTIIVLEPSVNPDGMDRFVNWVNTYRGTTPNADPNHIEHHQQWRTGRTNHFGFDLNRDWLLLSQTESQNRIPYFHQYQPHVLGDFHEMGPNTTYFFQPGIPSRTHPLTPKKTTELTQLLATFHGKALDQEERLYYSKENFDDFYYGKGSTYPDINGGIGVLFEQASSRGFQQDTINGLVTFEYGIQNHVLTSLSTIQGSWENRAAFKHYRQRFYKDSAALLKKEKFSGYLISEVDDHYRLNVFLNKLTAHQIKVYPLAEDYRLNGKVYRKNHAYYIPLKQHQYRVIQALFSQGTSFEDNTFYDVSGWTMPLAMDINVEKVERTWGLDVDDVPWQPTSFSQQVFNENAYAYAFEWHHYLAPKLLNQLLEQGIKTQVATKAFSTNTVTNKNSQHLATFSPGTILIPAAIQSQNHWREVLKNVTSTFDIPLFSMKGGLSFNGPDLGSRSMKPINQPKILLIGGKGTSQYEVAELLYYIDDTLNIPVTVVEKSRINNISLADYSHVFMVDGKYDDFSKSLVEKIKQWLAKGGVIFGQKKAAEWLSKQSMLKADFATKEHIDSLFDTDNLLYKDKERLSARKRIAGAIFNTSLDSSHPLTFGYKDTELPFFRNSTLFLESVNMPFITVATYESEPLLSGYADRNLVNKLANAPALIAHNVGKGRVIATPDVLSFRGYWLGSSKILANSIFFAKAFSASTH